MHACKYTVHSEINTSHVTVHKSVISIKEQPQIAIKHD